MKEVSKYREQYKETFLALDLVFKNDKKYLMLKRGRFFISQGN
jgi:hypothetical protein